MDNKKFLPRLLLFSLVLLLMVAACGDSDIIVTPAFVPELASPTPDPLQELFPTPTTGLFEGLFPTLTPSPTMEVIIVTATSQVVLPDTGADLTTASRSLDRLVSAALVVFGLSLVAIGLFRLRR